MRGIRFPLEWKRVSFGKCTRATFLEDLFKYYYFVEICNTWDSDISTIIDIPRRSDVGLIASRNIEKLSGAIEKFEICILLRIWTLSVITKPFLMLHRVVSWIIRQLHILVFLLGLGLKNIDNIVPIKKWNQKIFQS